VLPPAVAEQQQQPQQQQEQQEVAEQQQQEQQQARDLPADVLTPLRQHIRSTCAQGTGTSAAPDASSSRHASGTSGLLDAVGGSAARVGAGAGPTAGAPAGRRSNNGTADASAAGVTSATVSSSSSSSGDGGAGTCVSHHTSVSTAPSVPPAAPKEASTSAAVPSSSQLEGPTVTTASCSDAPADGAVLCITSQCAALAQVLTQQLFPAATQVSQMSRSLRLHGQNADIQAL
jgi:hypothetical protein